MADWKCAVPGCECKGPLYLHGRCHPRSQTWTVMHSNGKVLEVVCGTCGRHIATFDVVQREQEKGHETVN